MPAIANSLNSSGRRFDADWRLKRPALGAMQPFMAPPPGHLSLTEGINAGFQPSAWGSNSGAGPGSEGYQGSGGIFSDRDGSTFAQESEGAGAYQGLRPFDSQFGSARPQMTSWGEEWGAATKPPPPKKINPVTGVAMLADGTSVPHPPGLPAIIGDPQPDGKPNPELVLQTPQGLHVFPLKDLPKFGDGTVKPDPKRTPRVDGRVITTKDAPMPKGGLTEFYANNPRTPTAAQAHCKNAINDSKRPVKLPSPPLSALGPMKKLAYGTSVRRSTNPGQEDMLELLPNPYGTGFSIGAPGLDQPTAAPASAPVLSSDQIARTVAQADAAAARERAMNPQGINVGFTPRKPLTAFARPEMSQGSKDEARYGRMQRSLMRAGMRDPRIGMALLGGKAAGEQASMDRQQRAATAQWKEGQINNRTQAKIDAANARAEATRKAGGEQAEFERKLKLAKEQREADEYARSLNPDYTPRPIAGTNYGYIPATKGTLPFDRPPEARMTTFEGTDFAVPTIDGHQVSGAPTFQVISPEKKITLPSPSAGMLSPGYFGGEAPTGSFGASFAQSPITASQETFRMPGQFKPLPTGKGEKPPTSLDLLTQMNKVDLIINGGKDGSVKVDPVTLRLAKIVKAKLVKALDTNNDGVLSPEEIARATAEASPVARPSGGFLKAVGS